MKDVVACRGGLPVPRCQAGESAGSQGSSGQTLVSRPLPRSTLSISLGLLQGTHIRPCRHALRWPQCLLQKLFDLQCVRFGVAIIEKDRQLRAGCKVLEHIQGPVGMRQVGKLLLRRARGPAMVPWGQGLTCECLPW